MLRRNMHFTGWRRIRNREQNRSILHGGLAGLNCIALQRQREEVDALCKYAWCTLHLREDITGVMCLIINNVGNQ